jgi:PAS domain-containing protein
MKLLVISSWTLISTVFPPLRKDSSAAPELVINNWGVDFDYTIFSNIVIIINPDFTISWVNKQFTCTTGYTEVEAIGNRVSDLLHGPLTDNAKVHMLHRPDLSAY